MADDTPEPPAPRAKPAPRRRVQRPAAASEGDAKPDAPASQPVKPTPSKRTRKPPAARAAASAAASPVAPSPPAPKPRPSSRPAPRHTRRVKDVAPPPAATVGDSVRTNLGKAAVAGGLAAVGALATAALLSLRGSSSIAPTPSKPDDNARADDMSDTEQG